ncbi:MAG: nitroreductase family protein [Bacillota bacterium]
MQRWGILFATLSISILQQTDCTAATQNMLIAAQSIGIGTCWTQSVIHLFEGEQAAPLKKELGIPDQYKPLYAISLGYKAQDNQQAPPRKENHMNYIK